MKYKVGDVVRIISEEKLDEMEKEGIGVFPMAHMIKGLKVEIIEAKDEFYRFDVSSHFMFSEHVIEGLAEPFNKKELKELSEKLKTFKIGTEYFFELPEGYQFTDENGNVINATKIVLEKKKKEYPKTYEECCKVLGYDDRETYCICHTLANERLFESLYRLKVCRDAYCKIAGDEMGLGKPWEPDYDSGVDKFGIVYFDNTIMRTGALHRWERHLNKVLEFPTKEMRDAFYENFKELIESCKELL